jgi:hypothetical protein
MSKELKMLLVSLTLLVLSVAGMYVMQHYSCTTVGYQNLSGAHEMQVCEWTK